MVETPKQCCHAGNPESKSRFFFFFFLIAHFILRTRKKRKKEIALNSNLIAKERGEGLKKLSKKER